MFVEVTGEKLVGGGAFWPTPPPSWIGLNRRDFIKRRNDVYIFIIYGLVTQPNDESLEIW